MIFALDKENKKIHIDMAVSKGDYFCPYCDKPLVVRKGEIRQHHFAHKPSFPCSDEWERNGYYDMSEWHSKWQKCYPYENQEIPLQVGAVKHRADVLTGKTIIEFQHSNLSLRAFNERNNFYQSLGCKVIWVFDFVEQYCNNSIMNETEQNFSWNKPKETFNTYDVCSGAVEVFFQLKNDDDEKCLVKISDVSAYGFEHFKVSKWYSKAEFLEYTGMKDGKCPLPEIDDITENKEYQHFCKFYHLTFNEQQARAIQAVQGAVLLLAVPGSGKTTVLTARVAYMILCKQIPAENILVMTYTKSAAADMTKRFYKTFGKSIPKKIQFCTINSLADKILKYYFNHYLKQRIPFGITQETDKFISEIFRQLSPEYFVTESEIRDMKRTIAYVKNKMLSIDEIKQLKCPVSDIEHFLKLYKEQMKRNNLIDYDDQILYAYRIIKKVPDVLSFFQLQYPYICVDEAQDTSKLQHELIKLLAEKTNHIFMVGDEDQSVYGFRGAYPKALLSFKENYPNAFILTMETNYRSVPEIVEKASKFVRNNKGHYPKQMTAARSESGTVSAITVKNKYEQYRYLIDIIRENPKDTAILYRSHDSLIPLADCLIRNHIYYKALKQDFTFFTNKVVTDIVAFLTFSLNPYDTRAFMQIYYKCGYGFNKRTAEWTCQRAARKHIPVTDALIEQLSKWRKLQAAAEDFKFFAKHIAKLSPSEAIAYIFKNGYQDYIEEKEMDSIKIDTLLTLAKSEGTIPSFLERLKQLPDLMKQYNLQSSDIGVILSTVHSSKGMEYGTVYLPDIIDGTFPNANMDDYQEERRLFYVAVTRAKNRLFLIKIENAEQRFLHEILTSYEEDEE